MLATLLEVPQAFPRGLRTREVVQARRQGEVRLNVEFVRVIRRQPQRLLAIGARLLVAPKREERVGARGQCSRCRRTHRFRWRQQALARLLHQRQRLSGRSPQAMELGKQRLQLRPPLPYCIRQHVNPAGQRLPAAGALELPTLRLDQLHERGELLGCRILLDGFFIVPLLLEQLTCPDVEGA